MSLLFCSLQSGKYLKALEIAAKQVTECRRFLREPLVHYQNSAKLCLFKQLRAARTQDSFLFFGAQTQFVDPRGPTDFVVELRAWRTRDPDNYQSSIQRRSELQPLLRPS